MNWKKHLPMLACAGLVALGLIVAALIFAGAMDNLANRPMMGSFSGSLSNGGYPYPDLMESESLKQYLGLFPGAGEEYDAAERRILSDMEAAILSDKWPGFPYVKMNGRLYFSKQAVDEWFAESAKNQLVID